jgi:hypothetical protein
MGGVVERFRQAVQTKQVAYLSDITEQDCSELEAGMTKSSRWMTGHDQAPAENAPVPDPPELLQDIEVLDEWVKRIKKRRN